MRTKNPEKAKKIIEFVNNYFKDKLRTPSIREIESGTGISRPMVQRYLVDLDIKGTIKYDGISIITEYIAQIRTNKMIRLPIAGMITCGEFRTEEEWKGEFIEFPVSMLGSGEYFVLLADGDSMTGAGIEDGDYVIVEKTNTAKYDQIVVALDNNSQNTLKRLKFDKEKLRPYLHPENSNYEDIYPEKLFVQGVACKVIKNLSGLS